MGPLALPAASGPIPPRPLTWVAVLMAILTISNDSAARSQAPTNQRDSARSIEEGLSLERAGELEKALAAYERYIQGRPDDSRGFVSRGGTLFKLGRIEASIQDFDRAIELDPAQAPSLWQRGISLYYADRFDECARQFEIHRIVNPNDVENSVWHFLCLAPTEGPEKAREALLPVGPDSRVPMKEIYELFAGRIDAERVLQAAAEAEPRERTQALFYAHLYLGLYRESRGEKAQARREYQSAVDLGLVHYMGQVAKVALGSLRR